MKLRGNQDGVVLTSALLAMVALISIALAVFNFSLYHLIGTRRSLAAVSALATAEAGVEKFMLEINKDKNYPGSGGSVELFNNDIQGRGTYETTVVPGVLSNEKVLTATGKIYLPRNASQPFVTRKVKLILRGSVGFEFNIQSGTGPIYVFGNSSFDGEIHSNDFISIQDNAVSISGLISIAGRNETASSQYNYCSVYRPGGTATFNSSTVKARHEILPPYASPAPPATDCGISSSNSTITDNDSTVLAEPMPTVDKAGIIAGITGNEPCSTLNSPGGSEPYLIQSKHYPDNSSSGTTGGCNVILKPTKAYRLGGDIHIRGDLTIDRNTITVDNSLTYSPTIIVEGRIFITGNNTAISVNSSGYGPVLAGYNTLDSNGDKTLPNAIEIDGNAISLYANFVAPDGSIGFRAKGSVGSLAGKSLVVNSSGTITFVPALPAPPGTDKWDIGFYEQVPAG